MIILLRHGLDDERYIGGWSDIDLLPEGIIQVQNAAKYIKVYYPDVQTIYSSDIKRAISSAQILQSIIDKEIITNPIFRELNKGKMNGMLENEAERLYPEFINLKDPDQKYPSGSSMRDLLEQIRDSLEYISSLDNSVIVTHRGVINMLYYILQNKPLDMNKKQFGVTHASIHELDIQKKIIKKVR